MTTDTYFAQAREYKADIGRFVIKDHQRHMKWFDGSTLNLYTYCNSRPLRFIDPMGHETIVISGGVTSEDYSADGRYEEFKYQFIETALNDISEQVDSQGSYATEDITWVVVDYNYSEIDKQNFQVVTDKQGVNLEIIDDKEGYDNQHLNFYKTDISRMNESAFDKTNTTFYSCNTGTGGKTVWLKHGQTKQEEKQRELLMVPPNIPILM